MISVQTWTSISKRPIAATASSKTMARVCGGATASGTDSSCMTALGVRTTVERGLLLRADALEFLDQVLADVALGLRPRGRGRLLEGLLLRRRQVHDRDALGLELDLGIGNQLLRHRAVGGDRLVDRGLDQLLVFRLQARPPLGVDRPRVVD